MIPEAPFLFSVGALSASLAGLAGLVAALRRGADLRPIDAFRLRQIVEFAFANALLAIAVIPLASEFGLTSASRVVAGGALVYVVFTDIVLLRRMIRSRIRFTRAWFAGASLVQLGAIVTAIVVMISGASTHLELLFLFLLGRPMLVFLLVLSSFEEP